MSTRQDVFNAISDERLYQDRKWGAVEQRKLQVGAWLAILRATVTEAERAYSGPSADVGALDEMRKVGAVVVACMEQHSPIRRSLNDIQAQHKKYMTRKQREKEQV